MSHEIHSHEQTGPTRRRRALSAALASTAALGGTILTGAFAPAGAAPSTWEEPDNPAFAGVILVLGGSIVGILALITLLVYLPSMMGRGSGDLVYSDPEWFGGPRTGVKETANPEGAPGVGADTGGSGAQW